MTARERLSQNVRKLVDGDRTVSGILLAWGNLEQSETCFYGSAREVRLEGDTFLPDPQPLRADAIFDLASITKLFTCVAVLQLAEQGKLRLTDPVRAYDSRFVHLGDVPILDLLNFHQALSTHRRVDEAETPEEARERVFSILPVERTGNRFYTDMGAIVLKYVVESAAGTSFYSYLREHILLPLGMTETYAVVPEEKLARTVCYNYERRIQAGEYWLDTACPPGTVHDPKARILSGGGADLCGHAGLFSTAADMVRFAQGLLSGKLLPMEQVRRMGQNGTGRLLPDGTYTQHLGLLCYAKNPVQTFSEVPACFGFRTVALSGFTGNHISMDPEKGQFMLFLANRIHNRVTMATGRANPYETVTSLPWNDGHSYPVSQNFVFRQDAYTKGPIGEILAAEYGGEAGH